MKVKVVSIYPRPLEVSFPWSPNINAGSHTYRIEAGSPEKPAMLEVDDAFQLVYFGATVGYRHDVVRAIDIAKNIVDHFATGRVGQDKTTAGPGIFVLDPDRPLEEQIAEAQEKQDAYFDFLFREAQHLYSEGRYAEITDDHRTAARYLKQNPEWLRRRTYGDMKECPYCMSSIPAQAVICRYCQSKIADGRRGARAEK